MFSRIGKRITYTNVALTIALVFAMTGGAYAAKKYLITSTKQISPAVLKQLTGKAGPAGAEGKAGAQGAQGAQGAAGVAGKDGGPGTAGLEGKEGKVGKEGKEGKKGEEGKEGPPFVGGGSLPSGSTETGQWAIYTKAAAAGEVKVATISFPVPLAAVPTLTMVIFGDPVPAQCEGGTVAEPKAKTGNICVFEGEAAFIPHDLTSVTAVDGNGDFAAAKNGVDLVFQTGAPPENGEESAAGSWAVTG